MGRTKMKSRMLAWLLTLALIIGLVPAGVAFGSGGMQPLADEGEGEVVEAVFNGTTWAVDVKIDAALNKTFSEGAVVFEASDDVSTPIKVVIASAEGFYVGGGGSSSVDLDSYINANGSGFDTLDLVDYGANDLVIIEATLTITDAIGAFYLNAGVVYGGDEVEDIEIGEVDHVYALDIVPAVVDAKWNETTKTYTFEKLVAGYAAPPTAVLFNVTNTGNSPISSFYAPSFEGDFTTPPFTSGAVTPGTPLAVGGTATVTVDVAATLAGQTAAYADKMSVTGRKPDPAGVGDDVPAYTADVNLSITVEPQKFAATLAQGSYEVADSEVAAGTGTYEFDALAEGYLAPAVTVFTIKNTGNMELTDLAAVLSFQGDPTPTPFIGAGPIVASLAVGATDTFSIGPVAGLDVGVHEGTLTITYGTGTPVDLFVIELEFEVEAATFAATLSHGDFLVADTEAEEDPGEGSVEWPAALAGYTNTNYQLTFELKNTGNQDLEDLTSVITGGTAKFIISSGDLSGDNLAAGGATDIVVMPATGLTAGEHEDVLTIKDDADNILLVIDLSFEVVAAGTYTAAISVDDSDEGSLVLVSPREYIYFFASKPSQYSSTAPEVEFIIKNTGTATLTDVGAELDAGDDDFVIPTPFTDKTIAAGPTAVTEPFTVAVDLTPPYVAGTYTGTVTVSHSDGDTGTVEYDINLFFTVDPPVDAEDPVITGEPQDAAAVRHDTNTVELAVAAISPDDGDLEYQWYESNAAGADKSLLVGQEAEAFEAPINVFGTKYYLVDIVNRIADNGDGGNKASDPVSSRVAKVEVGEAIVTIEWYARDTGTANLTNNINWYSPEGSLLETITAPTSLVDTKLVTTALVGSRWEAVTPVAKVERPAAAAAAISTARFVDVKPNDWFVPNAAITGNSKTRIPSAGLVPASETPLRYSGAFTVSRYDVTYDAGAGATITLAAANGSAVVQRATRTVNFNGRYSIPPNPVRPGFTFEGWFREVNSVPPNVEGVGTRITNSVSYNTNFRADAMPGPHELKAAWKAATPVVTFNANGGRFEHDNGTATSARSTVVAASSNEYNPALTATINRVANTPVDNTPKRNGFVFMGWTTSKNNAATLVITPDWSTKTVRNTKNHTLQALWVADAEVPIKYNISTTSTEQPDGFPTDHTQAFQTAWPTTLEGWAYDSKSAYVVPTRTATNDRRLFVGWSGTRNATTSVGGGALSARWTQNAWITNIATPPADVRGVNLWPRFANTLTVNYDINTDDSLPAVANPKSKNVSSTVNTALGSLPNPNRPGYAPVVWTYNGEPVDKNTRIWVGNSTAGQDGLIDLSDINDARYDFVLKAEWTPRPVNVAFHVNGGVNGTAPATITNVPGGTNLAQLLAHFDPAPPTRTSGATTEFLGWSTTSALGGLITADSLAVVQASNPKSLTANGTMTLRAIWTTPAKQVTFNVNGGQWQPIGTSKANKAAYTTPVSLGLKHYSEYSWAIADMQANRAEQTPDPFLTEPVRANQAFAGWWTTKSGNAGVRVDNNPEASINVLAQTHTLWARWTASAERSVNFNANGGTLIDPRNNNRVATLTGNLYKVRSFNQYGNVIVPEGNGDYKVYSRTEAAAAGTSNVNAAFRWTVGSGNNQMTHVKTGPLPIPTPPSNVNANGDIVSDPLIFDGWWNNRNKNARGAMPITDISEVQNRNLTLFAHWKLAGTGVAPQFDYADDPEWLGTVTVGDAYSFPTAVVAGDAPITWSLDRNTGANGDKLDWLSINAGTGVLSGTVPMLTDEGTYEFSVTATNAHGSDTQDFSITIQDLFYAIAVVDGWFTGEFPSHRGDVLSPEDAAALKRTLTIRNTGTGTLDSIEFDLGISLDPPFEVVAGSWSHDRLLPGTTLTVDVKPVAGIKWDDSDGVFYDILNVTHDPTGSDRATADGYIPLEFQITKLIETLTIGGLKPEAGVAAVWDGATAEVAYADLIWALLDEEGFPIELYFDDHDLPRFEQLSEYSVAFMAEAQPGYELWNLGVDANNVLIPPEVIVTDATEAGGILIQHPEKPFGTYALVIGADFPATDVYDDETLMQMAKEAIEAALADRVVLQEDVDSQADAMDWVEDEIEELELYGVNYTVLALDYEDAVKGAVTPDFLALDGEDGVLEFEVELVKGGIAPIKTDALELVIVATPYDPTEDIAAVAAAKATIEAATFTTLQVSADNLSDATDEVNRLIGELELDGVTTELDPGTLEHAEPGNTEKPLGTNGSLPFTVKLSKGWVHEDNERSDEIDKVTDEKTLTIVATPSPDVDEMAVTLTVNKDGALWGDKGYVLLDSTILDPEPENFVGMTPAGGIYVAIVANDKTWEIHEQLMGGTYNTGLTFVTGTRTQELDYFTVNFDISDKTADTESAIAATYGAGDGITNKVEDGDIVLSKGDGTNLVITATATDATPLEDLLSFEYEWTGATIDVSNPTNRTNTLLPSVYTITDLSKKVDVEVEVEGVAAKFTVTLVGTGTGASGAGEYREGQKVDIVAGTVAGKRFEGWEVTTPGTGAPTIDDPDSPTTFFMMIAGDVIVEAIFVDDVYSVGLTLNLDGDVWTTGAPAYGEVELEPTAGGSAIAASSVAAGVYSFPAVPANTTYNVVIDDELTGATVTVANANVTPTLQFYTVTVTALLDDGTSAWTTSDKELDVRRDGALSITNNLTRTDGVYTGIVYDGKWNIYDVTTTAADTKKSVTTSATGDNDATVNYYTVTVTSAGTGTGGGIYFDGAEVTINAGSVAGSVFAGWTANPEVGSFTNPAAAGTTYTVSGTAVELTGAWLISLVVDLLGQITPPEDDESPVTNIDGVDNLWAATAVWYVSDDGDSWSALDADFEADAGNHYRIILTVSLAGTATTTHTLTNTRVENSPGIDAADVSEPSGGSVIISVNFGELLSV